MNAVAPSSRTCQVHWRLITRVSKVDASSLPFTAELLHKWVDYSADGGLQTGEDARLNEFFAEDDEPLLTGPTK